MQMCEQLCVALGYQKHITLYCIAIELESWILVRAPEAVSYAKNLIDRFELG